jgi:hypothetical protein
MTNVFTMNPIQVNVLSIINQSIIKKCVFVGIVPDTVELELKKIQRTKTFSKDNKVLKAFYGEFWYNNIGVSYLLEKSETFKNKTKQKGGDEFDFDDDGSKKKVKEAQISEEEISQLLNDDLGADVDQTIDDIFISSVDVKIKSVKYTDTILEFIIDEPFLTVYPQDKVSEFKKKIYIATKIPMYRQHLWFTSKSASLPMSYVMSSNDAIIPVNIQNVSNLYTNGKLNSDIKQIENIPLDIGIYNLCESIKIEAYDNFKIMEEYYDKYNVVEFNVADIKEFISSENPTFVEALRKSKQQFNLLYYGFVVIYWPMITATAFKDYIKGESNISNYYPELYPDYKNLKTQLELEKHIMDNTLDLLQNPKRKKDLDLVTKKIASSITSATINVVYVSNLKEKVIFPRNLFDKFALSDKVDACRCISIHEGKTFILDKTYKESSSIKEMIVSEGIIFRVNPPDEEFSSLILIFYKNGNYLIKSTWKDEYNYDFTDITREVKKLIDPIIDQINSLKSYSLYECKSVSKITKYNAKFIEIGINIYYKQVFTESQFAFLKFILEEFKSAGIMDSRILEKNFAEYYFRKGMYKFDSRRIEKISNIKNYYDYLSDGIIKQKWFTIFEKTRITKIWHRFSDIKIEIFGIREKEFTIFFDLILSVFNMYETRKKKTIEDYEFKKLAKKKIKKTLTNLKEQDPVLYDFKKIYKSNKVYSRICQKSYQPLLLNKEGYDLLPTDQKKHIVKYWNFTNETDAYYKCPNPKFPYIKFTTKNHPKDYCIPCCKKIDISSDLQDPKRIIHDICLKDHRYTKEKKTTTLGSKYIMTYGKDIEVGRLSRLPENSMEGIFFETFSMEHGLDPSYMSSDGFYLYGTNQNTSSLSDIGYVYSLAHTLELTLEDLIKKLTKEIVSRKGVFNILMNGRITQYISDSETLVDYITKIFGNPKSGDFHEESIHMIPWNKLFIDMAFNYLNINTILFQSNIDIEDIDLRLPNGLEDVNDYILKDKQNIIVLQKEEKYYPVYLINTDLFFKLGTIEKKTFMSHDGIIKIIKGIVGNYIKTIEIKGKTYSKINLIIIKEFLEYPKIGKKFQIHRLFINHSNFCYGVQLLNTITQKKVYIPIEQSYYSFNISPNLEFKPFCRSKKDYRQSFQTLMGFVNEFNRWVDIQSLKEQIEQAQNFYPVIKIESWLVLQKSLDFQETDKIIGFKASNLYYYFDDMTYLEAMKLRKVHLIPLLYDPDIINKVINKRELPNPDKRTETLSYNLYKYNIYQLFLLEFLTLFERKTNEMLRTTLKKLFIKDFTKNMNNINKALLEMIETPEDLLKIRLQLSDYINNHHDRKQLFLDIDNTSYEFDKIIMKRLMLLEKPALIKELKHISKDFVKIGKVSDVKNFDFPNMFASCDNQGTKNYCSNRKLIIPKEKLEIFCDILSSDILNPIKQKWIFSNIMSDRVVNFLQFIQRKYEKIQISLFNYQ